MKIVIESTTKVTQLIVNGVAVPARIWAGHTESGIPVHFFITRLAPTIPLNDSRQREFQQELDEQIAPTAEIAVYPLRLIL